MEKFLPLAEQLDRAAVELGFDHPLHNRLALILVDNAVELMVRHSLFTHSALGGEYPHGLNTAKQRKQARSQNFGHRLDLLVCVKELTQSEVDFVLAAHARRNAAYHEGFGGGPEIRAMSMAYYRFACRYLTRFSVLTYGWTSNFSFSEISRHYYDTCWAREDGFPSLNRPKLAAALEARLPSMRGPRLQDALADAIENDRRAIAKSFQLMVENSRPQLPKAELLRKIQFVYATEMALQKQGLENTYFGTQRRDEVVKFLSTKWQGYSPPYRAIPHGAWSKAIARIRATTGDEDACQSALNIDPLIGA